MPQGEMNMTKILFVEDEPRGVNAYFKTLERNGFRCVLVQDVGEAVAKLQAEKFDLMSLDVMFSPGKKFMGEVEPRLAGLFLLELIRTGKIANCDPNLRVIVLTAVVNKPVEEKIKRLGVLAYLKKPIDFNSVIETFKDASNVS
jgi:CheY-like chemotaxis protein